MDYSMHDMHDLLSQIDLLRKSLISINDNNLKKLQVEDLLIELLMKLKKII
ncbi:hypothetical protein [Spiroplasma ixodetis]|uniref:hypothetical protein n=1 Tax=Spiroplasma ixodetis TaxID=2141 RepID=UPI0025774FB4|nr:hypothetical protein [Spiroplasma ixodetis]WJG70891.1 hypothetical protein SIXOD_v1c21760 [Spiroplasma ixodetis Y32]